ncbi:hypothetical protein [Bdellovibrio bacteriovorus]|uniref:hypothetical protein n=1 Tax=Bdellovibrio bacteriovorus TaxID=959 RepID=UPI0035A63F1B
MKSFFLLVLLLPVFSYAQDAAFRGIDQSYSNIKSETEIKNMPRITSQDGLGICYAHVAATLMQAENCRVLKQECSSLPEEELFSPLDVSRFGTARDESEPQDYRSTYEGLQGVLSGGNPHNAAIIGALAVGSSANEACVSLDKILSKMNSRGETVEAQVALWNRLKESFDKYKKNKDCPTCLNDIYATAKSDIDENLNLTKTNEEVLKAFAQDTYDKFLDDLLGAKKCVRAKQQAFFENRNATYETYPESNPKNPKKLKSPVSAAQIKEKIKEILRGGRPLALAGVCLADGKVNSCPDEANHAVVVAGYRQICKADGKCRESLKVVNSWGKAWQDEFNGGWVDADTLMAHTQIKPDALGWFADGKKQQ